MTILQIVIGTIEGEITPEFYFNELIKECQTSTMDGVLKTELLHHYNRQPVCKESENWIWEINLSLTEDVIKELHLFMLNKIRGYFFNNLIRYGNIKYIDEIRHYKKYI